MSRLDVKGKFIAFHRTHIWGVRVTFIFSLVVCITGLISDGSATMDWVEIPSILLVFFTAGILYVMYQQAKIAIKSDEYIGRIDIINAFKEYIQVQGYLQTLIGFLIVIITFSFTGTQSGPAEMAGAIALALVSSILGWFWGNELINYYPEDTDLRTPIELLKTNLESLNTVIGDLITNYQETATTFRETQLNLLNKQGESSKNLVAGYEKTTAALEEFQERMATAGKNLESAGNTFIDSADTLFTEVSNKIDTELSAIAQKVTTHYASQEEAWQASLKKVYEELQTQSTTFSTTAAQTSQSFVDSLDKIKSGVEKLLNSAGQSSENVKQQLAGNLAELKKYLEDTTRQQQEMNDRNLDSSKAITASIDKLSTNIEQTKEHLGGISDSIKAEVGNLGNTTGELSNTIAKLSDLLDKQS